VGAAAGMPCYEATVTGYRTLYIPSAGTRSGMLPVTYTQMDSNGTKESKNLMPEVILVCYCDDI